MAFTELKPSLHFSQRGEGRICFLTSSSFWRPPAFLGSWPFLPPQSQQRNIFVFKSLSLSLFPFLPLSGSPASHV